MLLGSPGPAGLCHVAAFLLTTCEVLVAFPLQGLLLAILAISQSQPLVLPSLSVSWVLLSEHFFPRGFLPRIPL